ncbi:MAG: hypothetical protein NW205_10275 [Hyphomicrobiaceae bacterium]|nr:hypothetical protein [Hyphomicrobiaceae bacterium]
MLTVEDIHSAFTDLGVRAFAMGKTVEVAVYGGSALMLASNFRVASKDVDAVADTDQSLVDQLAREIAVERGWPSDWLNDGVRTYLSPHVDDLAQHHVLFGTYPDEQSPGLRVFVPTAAYLLAMKLMAMRIDPAGGHSDLSDILHLMAVTGTTTKEQLQAFAEQFYPEARVSGRLRLGIEAIWTERQKQQPGDGDAPRYPGRRGPTP